jgi:hypothetical protein
VKLWTRRAQELASESLYASDDEDDAEDPAESAPEA